MYLDSFNVSFAGGGVPCDPALPNCAMKLCKWNFKNCARVFVTAALVFRFYTYLLDVNHATSKKITTYFIFVQLRTNYSRIFHASFILFYTVLMTKYISLQTLHVCSRCTFAKVLRMDRVMFNTFPISTTLIRISESRQN